jgi:hypothetical protein
VSTVGSASKLHAGGARKRVADQEVAVAVQEEDGAAAGGAQDGGAFGFEAARLQHVVAGPGLEQVAQDEDASAGVAAM